MEQLNPSALTVTVRAPLIRNIEYTTIMACLSQLTVADLDLSSDDLEAAYQCREELKNKIQDLMIVRSNTISKLNEIIKELHKTHHDVNISKVVRSSVGIAGGVLSLIGMVGAPFTLGSSLALSAVGSGLAAAGGVTTTGATVAEFCISKSKMSEVQAAISADNSKVKEVKK